MNLDREPADLEGTVKALLAHGNVAEAVTLVIRECGDGVRGDLRGMLKDEDDVKDAFSEWSQRVLRGLPGFEFRCSLRTWCARLAVNVSLNFREDAWHRKVRRFESGEASGLAQSTHGSSNRRRILLRELRKELDLRERTLLYLRADLELPWNQIAEVLTRQGDPVDAGTVSKRFERLKAKIARLARRRHLVD